MPSPSPSTSPSLARGARARRIIRQRGKGSRGRATASPARCGAGEIRVAVIGAGLAGVGIAHALVSSSAADVVVFDSSGVVAGGASGSAAGLLHPLGAGRRGEEDASTAPLELPFGRAGVRATQRALQRAADAFTRRGRDDDARRLVADPNDAGVLRCSATGDARITHHIGISASTEPAGAASSSSSTRTKKEKESLLARCVKAAGGGAAVLVETSLGTAVDVALYLEGLWLDAMDVAAARGGSLELRSEHVRSPDALVDSYDAIVVACGAGIDALAGDNEALARLASSMQMIRGHLVDVRARDAPWRGPSVFTYRGEYYAALEGGSRLAIGATKLRICAADGGRRCGSSTGKRWMSSFDSFVDDADIEDEAKGLVRELVARFTRFHEACCGDDDESHLHEEARDDHGARFYPAGVRSGVRLVPPKDASTGAKMPLIGRLCNSGDSPSSSSIWFFVGLGFRGVVTHYLYAETLARSILDAARSAKRDEKDGGVGIAATAAGSASAPARDADAFKLIALDVADDDAPLRV